jgi:DNA primase
LVVARITKQYIQDLSDFSNEHLVDLVEQRIKLSHSGSGAKCHCPFHEEKTPSFSITKNKGHNNLFKCFGGCESGSGGGAVSFIMKFDDRTFVQTIEYLAQRLNFRPIEYEDTQKIKQTEKPNALIKSALAHASTHYISNIPKSDLALDYMQSRGIVKEDIERFHIGVALDEWRDYLQAARGKFGPNILIESGLLTKKKESSNQWDFFRNRLMFPVKDYRGHVVGFGARTLIQDTQEAKRAGKYINTQETDVFKKHKLLYGLYESTQQRSPEPRTINVVEGYLDVVASHRHGFSNTVAPMGTALGEEQIKTLLRNNDHIRLVFDGDAAGSKAAMNAVTHALPFLNTEKRISVVFMPKNADPDSVLSNSGKDTFQSLLNKSIPASRYIFSYLLKENPSGTTESKAIVANKAENLINTITNPTLKRLFEIEMDDRLSSSGNSYNPEASARNNSNTLRDHLDLSIIDTLDQATPEIVRFCALVLYEPAWLKLQYDTLSAEQVNKYDQELLTFVHETVNLAHDNSVNVSDVYSSSVRDLVIYMRSTAPDTIDDATDIISAIQTLDLKNNLAEQKKKTNELSQQS